MLLVGGGGCALKTGSGSSSKYYYYYKYVGYSICLQNQNTCIEAGEEAKKTGRWKLESAKI